MTIMVPMLQKNTLTLQQSQLQYQSMVTSSNSQNVTSKLSTLAANDCDMESNQVKQLQYMAQMFSQQQASIDSQLKLIGQQLEGLNKLIDTNIKNDCKLSLLG